MRLLLKKNRGQATVEYLLLIVVIIALALSIGRPLGDYLTKLSGAMLGPDDSYYACLMENAQLPGQACQSHINKTSRLAIDFSSEIGVRPGSGGGPEGGGPGDGDKSGADRGSGGDSSDSKAGDDGSDSDDPSSDLEDSDSSSRDRDRNNRNGRKGTGDSKRDRDSLSSRHKAGSDSESLSGGADSVLGRDRNQSEFLASIPGSASAEGEEEEEAGSLKRGRRGKKNKGFGSKFDTSDQEGYKQSRRPKNSEFNVGYLGDRYVEEEEQQSKKVFKSSAGDSFSFGSAGIQGDDTKSAGDETGNLDGASKEDTEVKKMNLMELIRYIVLAILIILVLAFLFSQAMEYQSRD